MTDEVKKKREEYKPTIGPLLKSVLVKQKNRIKEITMDCVNASEYEAGEIIAKKVIDKELV